MEKQTTKLRDEYESALVKYRAHIKKPPVSGTAGMSHTSKEFGLYVEMERARDRLISAGEWNDYIPIKSKAKHRVHKAT